MNLEGSSVVEVLWSFDTGGENVGSHSGVRRKQK